jgi:hypothetical protein
MNEHLTARVKARNRINAEATRLWPLLVEAVKPFVGKKVLKVDLELTAQAKTALEPILESGRQRGFQVFRGYHSEYSLYMDVKCSEMIVGKSSSTYAEQSLYIGKIDQGILTPNNDNPLVLRSDITVEEILAARLEAEEAQKKLDVAKNKLCGFDMRDY